MTKQEPEKSKFYQIDSGNQSKVCKSLVTQLQEEMKIIMIQMQIIKERESI